MKAIVTQITLFIGFILLLLIGIYGVITPDKLVAQAVGIMQIGQFENGLALYQGNRGIFYPISPFNDYIIYRDNERSALITADEISKKLYATSYEQQHFQKIITAIRASIFTVTPSIQFETDQLLVEYTTTIEGNSVIINQTIDLRNNKKTVLQAITLPYRGGDFVFDTTGQMYYFHLEEDKERFEKTYNIALKQDNFDLRINLGENSIIVINPSLTGAIVVSPIKGQRLFVDKNTKMIQLEQETQDTLSMDMHIKVYNNPQEAITQLRMTQ